MYAFIDCYLFLLLAILKSLDWVNLLGIRLEEAVGSTAVWWSKKSYASLFMFTVFIDCLVVYTMLEMLVMVFAISPVSKVSK
jgi:hypothetical protein